MFNVARVPTLSKSPSSPLRQEQALPGQSPEELLRDVGAALAGAPPLPGLLPVTYARTHAAFELLSDQRHIIGTYLADRLARRGGGPISVLSAGCGDGTLDAPLAAGLADVQPLRPVRYVGVDPYQGSTDAFLAALRDLGRSSLVPEVHTVPFDDLQVTETFDVVTFVHSMYYVRDVAQTLRTAYRLLRPGGELLVLSAPRAELNSLVEVLAPPLEGHEQWFSDDVATGLDEAGLVADPPMTLEAGFDAESASDEVLDFAVQARLTAELRPLVRAYLAAVSVPAPEPATGSRVPHPVDVYRVVRPG